MVTRFETKGFTDVTVAIEDENGSVVRHLASGLLGPNAPEPYQKDSRLQAIVWDGKDDQGRYVDGKERLTVRVSLGLRARLERTLFWEPKKQISPKAPLLCAAPEGVYVYDAWGVDHLRLFDHAGNYVKTVYPFPGEGLAAIKGLERVAFPGCDDPQPLRRGSRASTLLSGGLNGRPNAQDYSDEYKSADSHAASAVAVWTGGDPAQPRRIALVMFSLNRLAHVAHPPPGVLDSPPRAGAPHGNLPLAGPTVEYVLPRRRGNVTEPAHYFPYDAAFSPDGRFVYLAGYHINDFIDVTAHWTEFLHGVARVAYDGQDGPVAFKGTMTADGAGSDNERFNSPTSVACDAAGNVYVADYLNDRIQVFSPEGAFLKTIPVTKPVQVRVSPGTGEIYAFSWLLATKPTLRNVKVDPVLTVFGPLADARPKATWPLPNVTTGPFYGGWYYGADRSPWAAVDFWTDPPTVWLGYGLIRGNWGRAEFGEPAAVHGAWTSVWDKFGVKLFDTQAGPLPGPRSTAPLRLKCDFSRDVAASVKRHRPPRRFAQHLFVNPKTGKLYCLEYLGKEIDGCDELIELDPATGGVELMKLPFIVEDMAFGQDGSAYLVSRHVLWRSEFPSLRQIPFDYGEADTAGGGYRVISGLQLKTFSDWHHWSNKVAVSPTGRIAVSVRRPTETDKLRDRRDADAPARFAWEPRITPGRAVGEYIQLYDRYGQQVCDDALPGLEGWSVGGLGIDRADNVFVVVNSRCLAAGQVAFPPKTGVLLKVAPNRGRILSGSPHVPMPLPASERPGRQPELQHGWVDGAAWMFGGVAFNTDRLHCGCWHSSFAVDYFCRSFVPQPAVYRVAVLDANGNVILRVGRCGNVDDGLPLVTAGGPPSPRSIGGDEVALFTPNYVAVHTDQRLFIADAGNGRIVSVKLDYRATERVRLRDVPDQG